MEHNVYKFTIKFNVSEDIPAKEIIDDYLRMTCINMPQKCVESGDIHITCMRRSVYIAFLNIVVKDYGVPQVGVDIIREWVSQLYQGIDGFEIDAVIVHPKQDAKGAIIRWDYINDCPIVKLISPEA